MSIERRMGLDWWDLAVHVALSFVIGFAVVVGNPGDEEAALAGVTVVSLVILSIRRRIGLRRLNRAPTTGEVESMRLEELEARMAEMEAVHGRLAELEERVDFSERLLARSRVPELPATADQGER